jgi:hypothetical protein
VQNKQENDQLMQGLKEHLDIIEAKIYLVTSVGRELAVPVHFPLTTAFSTIPLASPLLLQALKSWQRCYPAF